MVRYVQDERCIAGEHMDVRRDCVSFARVACINTVLRKTLRTGRYPKVPMVLNDGNGAL